MAPLPWQMVQSALLTPGPPSVEMAIVDLAFLRVPDVPDLSLTKLRSREPPLELDDLFTSPLDMRQPSPSRSI